MFDRFKEFNKFRKTQGEIKKQLETIFVSYEKGDVSLLIRGDKRVEKLEIGGDEQKEIKEAINDAMKQVDKKVEKQMRGQLKDLGFPDL